MSQSRYGHFGEQKNLLFLPGIERKFLGRPAGSLVSTSAKLWGSVCEKQLLHPSITTALIPLFTLV